MIYEAKYNSYGERLRFDGWRIFNQGEEDLYYIVGPEMLNEMFSSTFLYTCLEAEHLGVNWKNERNVFKKMQETNRKTLIDRVIENWRDKKKTKKKLIFKWKSLSEEEMREHIHNLYNT